MSRNRSNATIAAGMMIAFFGFAISWTSASAQTAYPGHQQGALSQGMHAGHDHGEGSGTRAGSAAAAGQAPHGGQMAAAGPLAFEVVYRPKETRVYLYGPDHRPISARSVQGQIGLKIQGSDKVYRYPLSYVAPQAGSAGQDYLAVAVDVSRIRDGQMAVTVELANLPNSQQPRATLTQTFALSRVPVTVALLDGSDRPRIEQQKVCPVSGGRLGAMGTPIKVLVGGQPLYLCCKGCLGKVQANPEFYLQKVASTRPQSQAASSGGIIVATATAADQAAIAQQRVCVVSGRSLGAMGAPVKITAHGQTLFVCCRGCVGKVEKNPDYYLAKATQLGAGR